VGPGRSLQTNLALLVHPVHTLRIS
jgi:hypothetical protein